MSRGVGITNVKSKSADKPSGSDSSMDLSYENETGNNTLHGNM